MTWNKLLALGLLGSAAVFAQKVGYNFDETADFSKYKTYKWVEHKGSDALDELTSKQVKAALNGELSKKGLTESVGDGADLLVSYQVAIKQEKEFTSFNPGWPYGPGWGPGWGAPPIRSGTTFTFSVGTLVLDLYDSARHQLVWRGTATKTIDENAKPEKRQKTLRTGAAKLLKSYPPKKK